MQQVRGITVHRGHDLRFGGQARAGRLDIAVVTDQKEAPDTAVEQSVRQPREQRRAHDALQHQGLRISGFCRIVRNKDHCGHSNHGIRLLSHGNTAPLYQIFPHSSICFPPESKQIPAAGRLLFCRNPITVFLNRPGHGFLHRLWKTPKFLPLCGQSPRISGGETACTAKIPVYKPVQTGDNSRKCARVCKQGAGLCLPTGHALHFASPRGAGPALVKLPNRPDIFRRNFPPDCSILLRVYAIIKIEHLSGAYGLL